MRDAKLVLCILTYDAGWHSEHPSPSSAVYKHTDMYIQVTTVDSWQLCSFQSITLYNTHCSTHHYTQLTLYMAVAMYWTLQKGITTILTPIILLLLDVYEYFRSSQMWHHIFVISGRCLCHIKRISCCVCRSFTVKSVTLHRQTCNITLLHYSRVTSLTYKVTNN